MARTERIALFGGTFDPVHAGHLKIAGRAVGQAGLDRVIFLPCRQSPHKDDATGATGAQRLEMLRLATAGLPWAEVDDWELAQPGPSYSWKTAEAFRERFPGAQLFWLMGRDQWEVLATWSRADYLATLVTFLVHDREGRAIAGDFDAEFIAGDHPASASLIRERMREGGEVPAGWLHPGVEEYVRRHWLYRVE